MKCWTLDDFDEVWEYFHSNKEWFPHVRKISHKEQIRSRTKLF